MKRLLAAAALLALVLAGAASGGHARAARTVSSTRLVMGGHVRITAIIGTPVRVGYPLRVTYRVTNVSTVTRKIKLGFVLWYVVHSPDGTTYDTRHLLRGAYLPYVPPTTLHPGQTLTRLGDLVRVRWPGPLRITPAWSNAPLPAVSVGVKTSRAPSRQSAIADVLASTGHLLDHCAPGRSGIAVIGRIDAPDHSAPPLHARCSIALRREPGFFRAQVLVVSPPSLRDVRVWGPYEQLLPYLKPGQNATAIAWLFVVTRGGAISVDSASVESMKSHRGGAPGWQWTTSGFVPNRGHMKCDGLAGGGGGPNGPYIVFVSKCQ